MKPAGFSWGAAAPQTPREKLLGREFARMDGTLTHGRNVDAWTQHFAEKYFFHRDEGVTFMKGINKELNRSLHIQKP